MYLGNSNTHIFESDGIVKEIGKDLAPYFLVNWGSMKPVAQNDLLKFYQTTRDITRIGDIEEYTSAVKFTKNTREKLQVRKIYVRHPSLVPKISDTLFQRYYRFGIELYQFDIPYRNLVMLESASTNQPEKYIFNTGGNIETLKVLTYDIENLATGEICIIGYSSFDIKIQSSFDIDKEDSSFTVIEAPSWQDIEVKQIITKPEDEAAALLEFVKIIDEHDMISGHNIMTYDNIQMIDKRLHFHLGNNSYTLEEEDYIKRFIKTKTDKTNVFNMGRMEECLIFYPSTLDTYWAFRRVHTNMSQYTLKFLAKSFGINVKNRVYFEGKDFSKLDKKCYDSELFEKLVVYNTHDVMEQNGLTLIAILDLMPTAFLTCMSLDEAVVKSNTKMGDNVTFLRCIRNKRVMPPMAKASEVCDLLLKKFNKPFLTDEELMVLEPDDKNLIKIAKYRTEAPLFVRYPAFVLWCETVGGLTGHPNDDNGGLPSANSDFLPWYRKINADVTAMYPTLVQAKNACCDSVRFALWGEEPDDWIWIKDLREFDINLKEPEGLNKFEYYENIKYMDDYIKATGAEFLKWSPYILKPTENDYQDTGFLVGVIINNEIGMLNSALRGVVKLTKKIKSDKKALDKLDSSVPENKSKQKSVAGLYASLKAVRNSFTHGLVLATTTSCRSTNLASGSVIVSYANQIMYDVYSTLKETTTENE